MKKKQQFQFKNFLNNDLLIFAEKKAGGHTKNGRDSHSKYRCVKKLAGEFIKNREIILTQLGTKIHPGKNVGMSSNYTIFSKIDGFVSFQTKRKKNYPSKRRKYVNVNYEKK